MGLRSPEHSQQVKCHGGIPGLKVVCWSLVAGSWEPAASYMACSTSSSPTSPSSPSAAARDAIHRELGKASLAWLVPGSGLGGGVE